MENVVLESNSQAGRSQEGGSCQMPVYSVITVPNRQSSWSKNQKDSNFPDMGS